MRKLFLIGILTVLSCTGYNYAQNIINVGNDINAITTAIAGANAGDIFVLQRGNIYLYEGRIDVNVPLTIRSVGVGERAKLRQIPNTSGVFAGDPDIQVAADFTLQGVDMDGFRTSLTDFTGRAIRLAANGLRIVIDNCSFAEYWLRTIDLNAQTGLKIIYKNNLHLWDGRRDRIDNGRTIDTRGAGIDTLIFQNNTVLNCLDRYIRNIGTPGLIKYALYDHNTFYGNIGYRPPFQFRAIEKLIFTNNIIANVGLLGTDTVSNRADEIAYTVPYRTICKLTVTGTDTVGTTIDMRNNIVYNEARFNNLFSLNPDTVKVMPLWNQQFRDLVTDSAAAVSNEQLTFVKAPSLDSLIAQLTNYINGGTRWNNSGFQAIVEVLQPTVANMSYGTTAAAYTGSIGGFPVGDLNWYPSKKAEWEIWLTDVETISNNIPQDYQLLQNYPNPFNPSTKIRFNLPQSGFVSLKVFNLLGQEVAVLINEEITAGQKEVIFDASNLTSGLYLYKLNANDYSETRKMMLLK
jgi:hypothetical protein